MTLILAAKDRHGNIITVSDTLISTRAATYDDYLRLDDPRLDDSSIDDIVSYETAVIPDTTYGMMDKVMELGDSPPAIYGLAGTFYHPLATDYIEERYLDDPTVSGLEQAIMTAREEYAVEDHDNPYSNLQAIVGMMTPQGPYLATSDLRDDGRLVEKDVTYVGLRMAEVDQVLDEYRPDLDTDEVIDLLLRAYATARETLDSNPSMPKIRGLHVGVLSPTGYEVIEQVNEDISDLEMPQYNQPLSPYGTIPHMRITIDIYGIGNGASGGYGGYMPDRSMVVPQGSSAIGRYVAPQALPAYA